MKNTKKILALGFMLGLLIPSVHFSAENAEADKTTVAINRDWGDENGKFPDEGPTLIKEFTPLIYSNWEMTDFSAKWKTTGSYTEAHTLVGSVIAKNTLTFTVNTDLVAGQLTGIRHDGTKETWLMDRYTFFKGRNISR